MHTGMSNSIEEVPKLVYVFWTCKPVEYAIGNFKASLMPDYALRVPLRVQAAYLPQAYTLRSKSLTWNIYTFSSGVVHESSIRLASHFHIWYKWVNRCNESVQIFFH